MSSQSSSASAPTSSPTTATNASLSQLSWKDRMKKICLRLQFAWFLGHILLFFGLPSLIFTHNSSAYYRALFGSMMSYGVVLWRGYESTAKTNGIKQTLMKMARDVNAQYFVLSFIFWTMSNPCLAVLVPYFSFSVFHVLGYFRDFLLPTLLPSPSFASFRKTFHTLSTNFTNSFQPTAMDMAALWECAITPIWLLLQCLTFRQNIFALFVYLQFLFFRYLTSSSTRTAFSKLRAKGDQVFLHHLQSQSIMGKAANFYVYCRDYLTAWTSKLGTQFQEPARRASGATSPVHPHSQ